MINCNCKLLLLLNFFRQSNPQYRPKYRQNRTLLKRLKQCGRRRGMRTFDCIIYELPFGEVNVEVHRPQGKDGLCSCSTALGRVDERLYSSNGLAGDRPRAASPIDPPVRAAPVRDFRAAASFARLRAPGARRWTRRRRHAGRPDRPRQPDSVRAWLLTDWCRWNDLVQRSAICKVHFSLPSRPDWRQDCLCAGAPDELLL